MELKEMESYDVNLSLVSHCFTGEREYSVCGGSRDIARGCGDGSVI